MPKLIIDNIPVEVPQGANVLEAAQKIGVWVPHFCYHPALGSVGACRLCAVKFIEGPVKGMQMSCMIPAQDGMVVSTTDGEAAKMRQMVIEWLMINHPHDCPVCDEGGECLLQDYTVAGGHSIRRYRGRKRTHNNQYLGPYISHEMNRCIQCYRCVRFYQEFAGGNDFGVMGVASRVYFGRFEDGDLQSPFSGNLVDLCPTGVFTDKTARYRARYWDYEMAPSVCPDCSLGCNIIPAGRFRELLKIMGRRNDAVNGWFICDRGRVSTKAAVNDLKRPRMPLVDGQRKTMGEALDSLLILVDEVQKQYGSDSIALVGSSRLSLEGCLMLSELAEALASPAIFFADNQEAEATLAAVTGSKAAGSASMADVQAADMIVILHSDLLNEGAMMALAVRQAWRKGARIFVAGPEYPLPFEYTHVTGIGAVPLAESKKAVIIHGIHDRTFPDLENLGQVRTACLLPGPNSFGIGLLSLSNSPGSLSEAITKGKIKAVISVEADMTQEQLGPLQVLAAMDWRDTPVVRSAKIVLPTNAWVEMDGTFINYEGRAQRFKKAMNSGEPVNELAGVHPPHTYRKDVPGGESTPAWRILAELIERLGEEMIEESLSGEWEYLRGLDPEGEGVRVLQLASATETQRHGGKP